MRDAARQDPDEAADDTDLELVSFLIGGHEYSVDIMSVREIREWTRTTPLPHFPAHVLGVINLRGRVLTILDLALRLGLESKVPDARDVIVVLEAGDRLAGLRVDAVMEIRTVPRDVLQPPPAAGDAPAQGLLKAIGVADGRLVRLLDIEALLGGSERGGLAG